MESIPTYQTGKIGVPNRRVHQYKLKKAPSYSNFKTSTIAYDVFRQKQLVSNGLFYDDRQQPCVRLP